MKQPYDDAGLRPDAGDAAGLPLFVYGTLKRGEAGHHLLGPLHGVQAAVVVGRLWLHADGYPVLEVPGDAILADAHSKRSCEAAKHGPPQPAIRGPWQPIRGELVHLLDPVRRLALLDRYEDCRPRGPSAYRRVLVHAWPTVRASLAPSRTAAKAMPAAATAANPTPAAATAAWVYVGGAAAAWAALVPLAAAAWSAAAGAARSDRREERGRRAHPCLRRNRRRASCRRSRIPVK